LERPRVWLSTLSRDLDSCEIPLFILAEEYVAIATAGKQCEESEPPELDGIAFA
jgi:hypothetical protein